MKPLNLPRPRFLAVALTLLCATSPAGAGDLLQAWRDAQSSDPVFAAARAQYLANLERVPQARAPLMPQINGGASAARVLVERNGTLLPATTPHGWRITLAQPLFNWAAWDAYKQVELASAASEAQFRQAQIDLFTRVAQAYFDVLAAQDNVALMRAKQNSISQQLAQARRNFEVGTATITDANEAQARYDLAQAQGIAAQAELEVRRGVFAQLTGKMPEALHGVRKGASVPQPEPADAESWAQRAGKQNPGVVASGLLYEVARREVGKARAGHFPTLGMSASRAYSSADAAAGGLPTLRSSIGLELSVPIYSGGATQARVRETVHLEEKARQDLENAWRSAAQGARQAFLGVSTGQTQTRALEAAEASALTALESNRLGYEVGVRISIDVLNAQDQLYAMRRDLAKARYDVIVNSLKLKAVAGELAEDDLVAVNGLLAAGSTGVSLEDGKPDPATRSGAAQGRDAADPARKSGKPAVPAPERRARLPK